MDRRIIVVDLDDTLAASWRREHLIEDSWEAFHADLINDEPIFDMVRILQAVSRETIMEETGIGMLPSDDTVSIVGLTARPERYRQATIQWLARHEVPMDDVIMRPEKDFRPSPILKVALLAERFGGEDKIKDHVALIIDDREDVIQAFVGLGVTCLRIYARRA
jgi:hypothetical protein